MVRYIVQIYNVITGLLHFFFLKYFSNHINAYSIRQKKKCVQFNWKLKVDFLVEIDYDFNVEIRVYTIVCIECNAVTIESNIRH